MFIMHNIDIPKQYLNEIKSLDVTKLRLLVLSLVDTVTDIHIQYFDGPIGTSIELDDWINSLTNSQIITLTQYVLSLLEHFTKD